MRPISETLTTSLVLALLLSQPAVGQAQPQHGRVVNLNAVVDGAMVYVSYDMESDDPEMMFTVRLEFSQDGGETYQTAATVEGAVGMVTHGQRLTVAWSAGQDTETISLSQLQYRVVIENEVVPVSPVGATGAANLEVLSEPPGATVLVDGEVMGETPLNLSLDPGEHALAIARAGYLENRQLIDLAAGENETLSVTLTSAGAIQPVVGSGGGGSRLPLILGLAGGGAAAAVLASRSGGGTVVNPSLPCAFTVSPTLIELDDQDGSRQIEVATQPGCSWTVSNVPNWITISSGSSGSGTGTVSLVVAANTTATDREASLTVAGRTVTVRQTARPNEAPQATLNVNLEGVTPLMALTPVPLSADGSSDPDMGDSLTYSWDYGDGTMSTGLTVTHVYQAEGTFMVTLTVRDQADATGTASTSVVVKSMTGTWAATDAGGSTRTFDITQNGLALTGTYKNSNLMGTGTFDGSLTGVRTITFTAAIEDSIMMTTSIADDADSFTGDLTRPNGPTDLNQTFRRIQ